MFSCSSTKINPYQYSSENCNPIPIIQEDKEIGYLIKYTAFSVEKDNAIQIIKSFEVILNKKYGKYYNKYYRQYSFYLDKNGDIILNSLYLNKKEIESNPNWKCIYHEVGFYRKKYKKNFPDAFFYNSKTREISVNSL